MANGSAVTLLPLPQAPSSPEQRLSASDKPADPVENAIGEAVAAAAYAIAAAVNDGCQHGGVVGPVLKDTSATRLAAVAQLQLDYMGGDADFLQTARVAGSRALRRYFTDDVSPDLINATTDFYIDPVIEIVGKVVRDERVFRIAWAN